jgi:uncharacterized protein (DUF488 family)
MSRILTIGHGTLKSDVLGRNLAAHSVNRVVDVRSHPGSQRFPHFSRLPLERMLASIGIEYEWAGAHLGGRPQSHLLTPEGLPDYERMSNEPETQAALDHLARSARGTLIAVLCSESLPEKCHRSRMIGPELERRGVLVEHILPDGGLAHVPSLFA